MSRALAIDRVTPEQLAEEIGCSPRHVRKLARGLGACRVFGKTMFLMPDDVQAILNRKPERAANMIERVTQNLTHEVPSPFLERR